LEDTGLTTYARPLSAAFAIAALARLTVAPAVAGTAYDSVTRFLQTGAQQTSSQPAALPGTFSADFAQASTPPPPPQHLPFGLGKMAAAGQAAASMFTNGIAEKHYVGTTKERVDSVALSTAEITDCSARTFTHLDLAAKTYTVTSLDQPQPRAPSGGHGAPGPAATDDGSKMAIAMTTRALGPMKIEGVPTNGYAMNMKVTTTKPTGETQTFDSNITAYYSGMPEPQFSCANNRAGTNQGMAGASMLQYKMIMSALASKGNPRFTVASSGPSIPAGQLSMWNLMTFGTGAQSGPNGGGLSIVTERGNVRPVADGDPIFSVPAGFTKM
jgi:hypothetical protein